MDKKTERGNFLVAVGMPIYNEESYIAQTLDSILRQTLGNFEIIISDNASSDDTEKICRRYSDKDKRIKYFRNDENIGELANFNRAFELSDGEFFVWASGHDYWSPDFLEKCLKRLIENEKAVACFPFAEQVDDSGKIIEVYDKEFNTVGERRMVRFIKSVFILYDAIIYGPMRSDAIKKTRLLRYVLGPDHVFRVELSLIGEFEQVKEPLLHLRHHRKENYFEASSRRLKSWKNFHKISWFYLRLPHLATILEYVKGANRILESLFYKIIYSVVAIIFGCTRYARVILIDFYHLVFKADE